MTSDGDVVAPSPSAAGGGTAANTGRRASARWHQSARGQSARYPHPTRVGDQFVWTTAEPVTKPNPKSARGSKSSRNGSHGFDDTRTKPNGADESESENLPDTPSGTSCDSSPHPWTRPALEPSPYAQAPPKKLPPRRRDRPPRALGTAPLEEADASFANAAGSDAYAGRRGEHLHAGSEAYALPAAFRGLDAPGAPTPAMVVDAAPATALEWLATFGKSHVGLAEAVLTTLEAHMDQLAEVRAAGGGADPDDELRGRFGFFGGLGGGLGLGGGEPQPLLAAGEIEGIVKALKCHPSSDRLQALGIGLLGRMCDSDERIRLAFEAGAPQLVLNTMRALPSADAVQIAGCVALGQLAISASRARELAALGAAPAVLAALSARPERANLQAYGCKAIARLVGGSAPDPQCCQLAADEGALSAVVAALERHPCHEGVLQWATSALLRLSHDNASRAHLAIKVGAIEALRGAIASLPVTNAASTFTRTKHDAARATRLELVEKWLTLHERFDSAPASKAERVWIDMVWESYGSA